MKVTTVRLPESLYTDLEAEAEARDLSVSEYIRDVLRERENTQPNTLEHTQANTGLQERVDDLAERLEAVEAAVADDSFNSPGTEAENGALSEGEPERMEHPAGSDETVMSGSTEPETGADTGAWPAIEDLPTLHYHDEPADDLEAAARGALEDLEIPGRGEATEAVRREAVMWAWNYLREYRTRQSSEIGNATFGAYWSRDRLGYSASTGDPYAAYGLWDSYLRDALKELPHVEAPPERGSTWRFVGDEPDRKSEAEQFIVVQETE